MKVDSYFVLRRSRHKFLSKGGLLDLDDADVSSLQKAGEIWELKERHIFISFKSIASLILLEI